MTRDEFEIYKKELRERFYLCHNFRMKEYLMKEKNHRYLFRCTHYKTGRYFWAFDKSKKLMKDVAEWKSNQKEVNNTVTKC